MGGSSITMHPEIIEEEPAEVDDPGDDDHAADALEGNDGIACGTKIHEGWKVSYRSVAPEKAPVQHYFPRLLRLRTKFGAAAQLLPPPRRHAPASELAERQEAQRAKRRKQQI